MHRSGTSLCANMLHAHGVNMADDAGISPNNQRGHWERARVNDLNDEIFALFGRSWSSAAHVLALPPHWLDDPRVHRVRTSLIEYLSQCLASAPGMPWGLKDPRITRLLPLWRQVFAALDVRPRFVFCVRDPAQVARSLTARDRLALEQAEYRWLVYHTDAVVGIGTDEVRVIPYEDWFARPADNAERLAQAAGLPALAAAKCAAILDPSLRHDSAETASAKPSARRLHQLLARGANAGHFGLDIRNLCLCLAEFEQQVQPLLVESEILRVSVADQNRVIGDLNEAIRRMRQAAAKQTERLLI
jgi:hypothetical protein